MQPSLLCKGLRGAQWHLGSYDCQNLHHNTHKRGGPKWPPIRPQGLKMRSRTTGIFYKKKLHPFILQKNSFCSSIVLEHIYTWRNIYTSHPHHCSLSWPAPEQLSCDSVIFVFSACRRYPDIDQLGAAFCRRVLLRPLRYLDI